MFEIAKTQLEIDLATLRCFLYLCETKSFSETARRLNKTQSAVSIQISKFEKQIGHKLLIRNSRNVYVTKEGKQIEEYAKKILSYTSETIDQISSDNSKKKDISIGISSGVFSPPYELISSFQEQYDLQINIFSAPDKILQQRIANRTDDLMISCDQIKNSQLISRDKLYIVKAKGFEVDLNYLPVVCLTCCQNISKDIDRIFSQNGIKYEVVATCNSAAQLFDIVKNGIGVSFIDYKNLTDDLEIIDLNLKEMPFAEIYCHYIEGKHENKNLEKFIDHLNAKSAIKVA